MPEKISTDAQNLIKQLLMRNPQERLGAVNGFDEIRDHPFFADVDWENIYYKRTAPEIYEKKKLKNKEDKIDMDDLVKKPKDLY